MLNSHGGRWSFLFIVINVVFMHTLNLFFFLLISRLQLQHGIESLSDSLILKIFSNLDAKSLSNCGKVIYFIVHVMLLTVTNSVTTS